MKEIKNIMFVRENSIDSDGDVFSSAMLKSFDGSNVPVIKGSSWKEYFGYAKITYVSGDGCYADLTLNDDIEIKDAYLSAGFTCEEISIKDDIRIFEIGKIVSVGLHESKNADFSIKKISEQVKK